MKQKIINVKTAWSKENCFSEEYEINKINELKFDYFVYSYESGCYEGSGFAIWKIGNKFCYDDLGHCSCYGPLDNLHTANNVQLSFTDLIKILPNYNYKNKFTEAVLEEVLKLRKK